jgi:hypothetical protein
MAVGMGCQVLQYLQPPGPLLPASDCQIERWFGLSLTPHRSPREQWPPQRLQLHVILLPKSSLQQAAQGVGSDRQLVQCLRRSKAPVGQSLHPELLPKFLDSVLDGRPIFVSTPHLQQLHAPRRIRYQRLELYQGTSKSIFPPASGRHAIRCFSTGIRRPTSSASTSCTSSPSTPASIQRATPVDPAPTNAISPSRCSPGLRSLAVAGSLGFSAGTERPH